MVGIESGGNAFVFQGIPRCPVFGRLTTILWQIKTKAAVEEQRLLED